MTSGSGVDFSDGTVGRITTAGAAENSDRNPRRFILAARSLHPALPEQVRGKLTRGSHQGGDRLLHELEPNDPPHPDGLPVPSTQHSRNRCVASSLGSHQGGDRLLHELEPNDPPHPDDRKAGELDRDRPVCPGEQQPHSRELAVKSGSAPA
jgi:hypothetical protein